MKLTTKPLPKWLLIPPAVAALLLLGIQSMQGDSARTSAGATPTTEAPATKAPTKVPSAPRTPDGWQMASALLSVVLLGGGGLLAMRRLRQGARPTDGASVVTLRQSLRVSQRLTVHAFEFDERLVLVGESDKGLALLDTGRLPERVADEAEVTARAAAAEADDDGAVPKNLLIPRPAEPPARRLPRPATVPTPPPAPAKTARADLLSDFRTLLQQAGRS